MPCETCKWGEPFQVMMDSVAGFMNTKLSLVLCKYTGHKGVYHEGNRHYGHILHPGHTCNDHEKRA